MTPPTTTITLAIKTNEFTPEDVLNGLWTALAVVGLEELKQLQEIANG